MRVQFDATLSTRSQKGEFSRDAVSKVYVTNRDDCTYCEAAIGKNGSMKVEYDMQSLKTGVKLTDRIKMFFFFTDVTTNTEMPICAGHLTLEDLITRVQHGGPDFPCGSNFTSNEVKVSFKANPNTAMHIDLQRLMNLEAIEPSALNESAHFLKHFHTVDESVRKGLSKNLEITSENGGPMFSSLFTGHIMEGEATLYNVYHIDFDGAKNVPPWLCTYMMAETLHHNAMTCEDVKSLRIDELTRFVASFAQGVMRSATAAPYTSDYTMNEDPNLLRTGKCTMLSEVFKRPFSYPYPQLKKNRNGLMYDDCEGLAALIRDVANSTQHLRSVFGEDAKKSEKSLEYSQMIRTCFPDDLFREMPLQDKHKLMDLVMYVGEHLESGKLECKITLVSANAPSMSGPPGTKEIQAHACASLLCHDSDHPMAVMLEGTACMVDEIQTRKVLVGTHYIPLADIANSLSADPRFNTFLDEPTAKYKTAVHLAHTKGSFYRTAFCQSETLLGSQIGSAPITYGVDMEFLADRSILVHMPVQGTALLKGEFDNLQNYVRRRAVEIHPPLVDHDLIRDRLQWTPITLFKGCNNLQSHRPFITCLIHVTAQGGKTEEDLLVRCQKEADKFNADPKHANVGLMRAFPSMDGVSKVLHIYSDDVKHLETCLSPA